MTTSSEFQDDGRLVRCALEALADEPLQVVATVPSNEPREVRRSRKRPRAPLRPAWPVLDRAACAVTHGGMGATQKALARGVPVCAVPFGRDQLEVARRVEVAAADPVEELIRRFGEDADMASYSVNERGVARARRLIEARQYVLQSDWGDVQPRAREQNAFLESHSWDEYAEWHLGLTDGAPEETKARYGFVYGDFRRLHRMGLIACHYRAAEWRHKDIELAAHDLLQLLDAKSG